MSGFIEGEDRTQATLFPERIYGYLNRIQSSGRLEREAGRNVELMWLLGRLAPDFKTIADFRKNNGEATTAKQGACERPIGALSADNWTTTGHPGSKFEFSHSLRTKQTFQQAGLDLLNGPLPHSSRSRADILNDLV